MSTNATRAPRFPDPLSLRGATIDIEAAAGAFLQGDLEICAPNSTTFFTLGLALPLGSVTVVHLKWALAI